MAVQMEVSPCMAHAARLPNKHIAAFRYNDKIRHARALLCILFTGQVAAKRDKFWFSDSRQAG